MSEYACPNCGQSTEPDGKLTIGKEFAIFECKTCFCRFAILRMGN